MRECKLRSGVNWQGELKQNVVKQTGVREGLGVITIILNFCRTWRSFTHQPLYPVRICGLHKRIKRGKRVNYASRSFINILHQIQFMLVKEYESDENFNTHRTNSKYIVF
jgi:hypothetical protein